MSKVHLLVISLLPFLFMGSIKANLFDLLDSWGIDSEEFSFVKEQGENFFDGENFINGEIDFTQGLDEVKNGLLDAIKRGEDLEAGGNLEDFFCINDPTCLRSATFCVFEGCCQSKICDENNNCVTPPSDCSLFQQENSIVDMNDEEDDEVSTDEEDATDEEEDETSTAEEDATDEEDDNDEEDDKTSADEKDNDEASTDEEDDEEGDEEDDDETSIDEEEDDETPTDEEGEEEDDETSTEEEGDETSTDEEDGDPSTDEEGDETSTDEEDDEEDNETSTDEEDDDETSTDEEDDDTCSHEEDDDTYPDEEDNETCTDEENDDGEDDETSSYEEDDKTCTDEEDDEECFHDTNCHRNVKYCFEEGCCAFKQCKEDEECVVAMPDCSMPINLEFKSTSKKEESNGKEKFEFRISKRYHTSSKHVFVHVKNE